MILTEKGNSMNIKFPFIKRPAVVLTKPVPIQISDFDNVWNQLAIELARPHLHWSAAPDEAKIRALRAKLNSLILRAHGAPEQLEFGF
jgi:hypothetical protein